MCTNEIAWNRWNRRNNTYFLEQMKRFTDEHAHRRGGTPGKIHTIVCVRMFEV